MKYKIIAEGFVSQRKAGTNTSLAAGSRCVATKNGELICTFVAQTATGGNDFKPMISRSKDGGLTWSEATLIWPEIQDKYSIFGSISAAPTGGSFFLRHAHPDRLSGGEGLVGGYQWTKAK